MKQQRPLLAIFLTSVMLLLFIACTEVSIDIPVATSYTMPNPILEIYEPSSGSTLPANTEFIFEYSSLSKIEGTYIKLHVNKQRPVTIAMSSGKHRMKGLPAGQHMISITEYSHDGQPTGGFATIFITMEVSKP